MDLIDQYFPDLTPLQRERFAALGALYAEWNSKINVISRRDMEHFYERHVLHSLAIGRLFPFPAGARVMDVGTGGGFPGIPLAILFPEARFWLVDSIGKKITVVREVARALELDNVIPTNARAETVWTCEPRREAAKQHCHSERAQRVEESSAGTREPQCFDFIVSRAVTDMSTFLGWIRGKITPGGSVLYLKGGDLAAELAAAGLSANPSAGRSYTLYDIHDLFPLDFFETKRIVRLDF